MVNYKRSFWNNGTALRASDLNNLEEGVKQCSDSINNIEEKIQNINNEIIKNESFLSNRFVTTEEFSAFKEDMLKTITDLLEHQETSIKDILSIKQDIKTIKTKLTKLTKKTEEK